MQGMYSMRSPAVKRLMKEAQELREPTEQYEIHPLEDNLFEWHFTIRGPSETEFETGFYHGRIILPPDYPMKPPSIIILTPNGRFEVNKKICLSISGHHPESWQPSWSLRTALLAIIGFMPTHGAGALGSLDYTPEERKVLARRSQDFTCPTCGRIDNILKPVTEASEKTKQEAKELASQIDFKDEKEKKAALQTAGPAEEGIQESASSAEATPDSAQQSPLPQQTFQFPTQPFGPSPFPFQMPFMQQGFPQMFPQQGADHPSSNSQVPRFPLPFVGPMMPPPFFPPGMNPGNFPLPPMMPGMGMPPWQQTVAGDSASSAGVSVGEQSQTNAEDSSQGNVETINSTTEAAGAESAQNEGTTHNQSANDSGTQQQTVPQTGSSESVNLSEGLRQRNVPEQSTSPSSTVQSSASPTSTQPAVPQPRTSEPESPAFIIFASIIIGLIFLLLFRRIWSMKYFSLIFQE